MTRNRKTPAPVVPWYRQRDEQQRLAVAIILGLLAAIAGLAAILWPSVVPAILFVVLTAACVGVVLWLVLHVRSISRAGLYGFLAAAVVFVVLLLLVKPLSPKLPTQPMASALVTAPLRLMPPNLLTPRTLPNGWVELGLNVAFYNAGNTPISFTTATGWHRADHPTLAEEPLIANAQLEKVKDAYSGEHLPPTTFQPGTTNYFTITAPLKPATYEMYRKGNSVIFFVAWVVPNGYTPIPFCVIAVGGNVPSNNPLQDCPGI